MKKIFSISMVAVVSVALLLQIVAIPALVHSQNVPGPSTSCDPSKGICNPLNVNSVQDLIAAGLKFTVNLLAVAGALYIMYAGLMLVMAQGDPKKLESAKKAFMNAIIGMAIILGAWAIAQVIANTISQVTQNKVTLNPIK